MSNIAINCKTHFSLLKGFCRCDDLAKRCKEYGYTSCVLADIKTISGAVDFHQACRKHGIKPIIGCDFGDFLILAKNKDGWFDLIKCVSDNSVDNLRAIANNGNLISVSDNKAVSNIFGKNHFVFDYKKNPVYYVNKEDIDCHRILLCAGMKTTIPKVNKKLRTKEKFDNEIFFRSDDFYLKKPTQQSDVLNKIDSACEEYDINEKPKLPTFSCPDNMTEDDYLRQLCRIGWKERLIGTGKVKQKEKKNEYAERIKYELGVILRANLSGYFLIVQDIVNEIKRRGWIAGVGRGSAAGCLMSFLIGITEVDPIEHGLIFERFYNEGRNTDGNISLPDIDVDVPAEHRDDIIEYIKSKYGHEKVSQMITFGRLQGRAALKEVLRINEAVSFAEMNEITKYIPNEAEISDQLELMEDKSIINWALENEPESLKNWCKKNEDGSLEGPLADIFKQAINIEGTNKSQGKHAAGVIISKNRLQDTCPMVLDKNNQMIAAFEMNDLESQGHVKFDILGIDLLSKVMEITGG
jgi:DNA polymerase-3 subunit alpha